MTEEENWKDILGYEGFYQVSNLGRVRSVGRIVKGVFGSIQHKKSVILAPAMNTAGYGCLIGLDSNGELRKQSDWGNFMRYPIDHIASDKEIDRLMRKIMYAEHITNY
jgi:hypothetical protein